MSSSDRSALKIIAWLVVPNAALFTVYMGLLQVLLPSHIALIDPANKIESLGFVTGVGALFATFANPVAGALSDRTRSRFGRRTPWLIGCAAGAALCLALMARADTIVALAVAFCLLQMLANGFQAVITAVMPERVPVARRGLASSAVGLCFPLGIILGTALVSRYLAPVAHAYWLLGTLLLAAALLFVWANPDRTPLPAASAPMLVAPLQMLSDFFSALAAHDFRWTFLSRFFTMLTFALVSGFQLYLLQDFIALPPGRGAADMLVQLNAVQMPCMVLATLLGGPLSDYCGGRRKVFVLWSALGMGVALVALLLNPDPTGVLVFAVLNGLSFGAYLAVDTALITQVLPDPQHIARDLGILNIATAGPQIIAPFIGAQIVTGLGGYPALLVGGALAAILAGLAILKIRGVR
nr:MFS transporter [uncultured Duganella sp.]